MPLYPPALSPTYDVRRYGADPSGVADSTAAVQAAINASAGIGPVIITGTIRCNGQLTHPGGYVRITSGTGANQGILVGVTNPPTGPILDLRYSGAGAKFVCLRYGVIEIDHITIADLGTSSTPFLLVTVAVPKIHDAYFVGNAAKAGITCDQDAIILGGTDTTQVENVITSAFAGYGGYVRGNGFSRIRRSVYLRNDVNGISVKENWNDWNCGSNVQPCAPYELDSGGTSALYMCESNSINDNTIELMPGYTSGVRLANNSSYNWIMGNGYWDYAAYDGAYYVSDVYVDETTGCIGNQILNFRKSGVHGMVYSNALNTDWGHRSQVRVQSWLGYILGTRGLLGAWTFGEPSGTVAADISGGGNPGAYANSPTLGVAGALQGDPGTAVTLNGTTQFVTINGVSGSGFRLPTSGALSFVIWVNRAGTGIQTVLSDTAGNFGFKWELSDTTFSVKLTVWTAVGDNRIIVTGGTGLTTGWHMLAVTIIDGGPVVLYVDAASVGTGSSWSGTSATGRGRLDVGYLNYLTSGYLNGSVNKLAAFNRGLSRFEIEDLMDIWVGHWSGGFS